MAAKSPSLQEHPVETTPQPFARPIQDCSQRSFSHLKTPSFWKPQAVTELFSKQLSFFPDYCQASGSFLEFAASGLHLQTPLLLPTLAGTEDGVSAIAPAHPSMCSSQRRRGKVQDLPCSREDTAASRGSPPGQRPWGTAQCTKLSFYQNRPRPGKQADDQKGRFSPFPLNLSAQVPPVRKRPVSQPIPSLSWARLAGLPLPLLPG